MTTATNTPIVFIHGYGSEGRNTPIHDIYGELPQQIAHSLGQKVVSINLSRWISLSDGIHLEDVSFALERALRSPSYQHLLDQGFRCIVHSTGALVIRHWLKEYSPKPSPLNKVIYLAGAFFGSGLAHMGMGQLSRWAHIIFKGTSTGLPSLRSLEFGANVTIDLHQYFLQAHHSLRDDFGVYEYCMVGSQTLPALRMIPNRYVKEDSSDCTLRTASANANFNYFEITYTPEGSRLSAQILQEHIRARCANQALPSQLYKLTVLHQADQAPQVPYALLYETAHIGDAIGIMEGRRNRTQVLPRIKEALTCNNTPNTQQHLMDKWQKITEKTLNRAAKLKQRLNEWNPQSQYEAHSQVIFRVRDQFGRDINEHDITFKSHAKKHSLALPLLIEDKIKNSLNQGNTTYYFRVQRFEKGELTDRLANIAPITLEITGVEPKSPDMHYLPVMLPLSAKKLRALIQPFKTSIVDVILLRLPSHKVFALTQASVVPDL
ncbi:esterase/lipase family protein [Marinagarivorans algicola]|uniref:esterase/lipase family protein n=1 Tax=Marinagarivorans algicola TaxID=1513270 RepID=UPI0006B8F104|nr:hypothetical protein [Marinagarivorans algicola]